MTDAKIVLQRIKLRSQELPVTFDYYLIAPEYAAVWDYVRSLAHDAPAKSATPPEDVEFRPPLMCYSLNVHPIMSIGL